MCCAMYRLAQAAPRHCRVSHGLDQVPEGVSQYTHSLLSCGYRTRATVPPRALSCAFCFSQCCRALADLVRDCPSSCRFSEQAEFELWGHAQHFQARLCVHSHGNRNYAPDTEAAILCRSCQNGCLPLWCSWVGTLKAPALISVLA